jgi:hypothetical protein
MNSITTEKFRLLFAELSMTDAAGRFRCPSCGFTVFNRRVAKCESCSAALPVELRFTSAELACIEAEHEVNEKIRADLARETAEREALEAKRRRFDGTPGGG